MDITQPLWAAPAPGTSFRQRADLTVEHAHSFLAERTGVPAERWLREKQLFLRSVAPPDAAAVRQQLRQAARSPEGVSHTFRLRHAAHGRLTHLAEFRRATLDERGRVRGYEGCWLDVTRWAELEQRLAGASWKETLSAITMGMVHDFNNALTGILSLSEHFHSQTDAQHPFHEGLGFIRQNARHAANLAHRLLRLHHDQPGAPKLCDLNPLVGDLMDLLRRFLPKRIELVSQLGARPLPVEVETFDLQRVIIYLAMNAAEAIAERGRITLETSFHPEPPALRDFVGQPPRAASACLTVTDTGKGVQAAPLTRIFEPFFTTKAPGQGAGLGLHHARLFAERHQGALSVETAEGRGSAVRLWLPFVNLGS
jgi:signal transduction histidine kinase